MRTPLTYFGGKQMIASDIVDLMPRHDVYLEPFCGGAAVLFAKPRAARETLNDLDGRFVAFWRVVRDRPDDLAAAIYATPYARDEWRASRGDVDDDLECARRLLVEFDQSFSRSASSWSPPSLDFRRRGRWQPGSWANLPPKIIAAAERLRGVCLERADGLELIPRWDLDGCVIYADPPYSGAHRLDPSKRYRHDDLGDWRGLVEVLSRVKRATVLLSGYPCDAMDDLGWSSVRMVRRRTVQTRDAEGVRSGSLAHAPEMVWISPGASVPTPMAFDWTKEPADA